MHLSILYITHDLSTLQYICDRTGMILGKLMEIGKSINILRNSLHPYTQALLAAVPRLDPDSIKEKVNILRGDSIVHETCPRDVVFLPGAPKARGYVRKRSLLCNLL